MAWWQYALIAFVVAWVLQAYGVWRQTRHYQAIFSELRKTWSDGALGAGAAPSRLGKGVIALVVAGTGSGRTYGEIHAGPQRVRQVCGSLGI